MKTTNYYNTFIEVAEDCDAAEAQVPPQKEPPTVADMQYRLISENPYRYTSDDVIFMVHAVRKEIPQAFWISERQQFFSKGQACLRTSPLARRYGWGIHHNDDGRVAIYPKGSPEYLQLSSDSRLTQLAAMRTARKK